MAKADGEKNPENGFLNYEFLVLGDGLFHLVVCENKFLLSTGVLQKCEF